MIILIRMMGVMIYNAGNLFRLAQLILVVKMQEPERKKSFQQKIWVLCGTIRPFIKILMFAAQAK